MDLGNGLCKGPGVVKSLHVLGLWEVSVAELWQGRDWPNVRSERTLREDLGTYSQGNVETLQNFQYLHCNKYPSGLLSGDQDWMEVEFLTRAVH